MIHLQRGGRFELTATGADAAAVRSVLEGAFLLLQSLREEGEAGLATPTGATGLPKTTAYRLLEQLAGLCVLRKGRSFAAQGRPGMAEVGERRSRGAYGHGRIPVRSRSGQMTYTDRVPPVWSAP